MNVNRIGNKGFTLIELMIVVVIIGILAALAIPRFGKTAATAKQAEAQAPLAQICTLSEMATLAGSPAGDIADLVNFGWEEPRNSRFVFTFNGTAGVATPRTDADGLKTATMTCADRTVALSEPTAPSP